MSNLAADNTEEDMGLRNAILNNVIRLRKRGFGDSLESIDDECSSDSSSRSIEKIEEDSDDDDFDSV